MYRWLAGTTPIPYAPIRVLELLLERKRAKISVDEPEAVS
jgi:hypothetical protein